MQIVQARNKCEKWKRLGIEIGNHKSKNPNPLKRVQALILKESEYEVLIDTLCIFFSWVKYGYKYLSLYPM
jgi:hypothetical protein